MSVLPRGSHFPRRPKKWRDLDLMASPRWVDEEDVREATTTSAPGSSSSFTPWPPVEEKRAA